MEFKINDKVMYKSKKIYVIDRIEQKSFGDEVLDYYVLIDENDENDIVYLPTNNQFALKNIRHLLTKDEIINAIKKSFSVSHSWNVAYKERLEHYNEILKNNNIVEMLSEVRMLLKKKIELEKIKKNLSSIDLTFLKNSMQTVNDEFSYVLGIDKDDVESYIINFEK